MIDEKRLTKAANDYVYYGEHMPTVVEKASKAITEACWSWNGGKAKESDVLRLAAATIVLLDNLGYTLETVLTKLEQAKEDDKHV